MRHSRFLSVLLFVSLYGITPDTEAVTRRVSPFDQPIRTPTPLVGYVPVTALCQAIAASWDWDPLLGRLEIILTDEKRLTLLLDTDVVGMGGELFQLKEPMRFINGRLMVPQSFVSDVLEPLLGGPVALPTPTPIPVAPTSPATPTPTINFGPLADWPTPIPETMTADQTALSPEQPQRTGRFVVVLDPGHGGDDPGSTGVGSTTEAEVVLSVAQMCEEILEQAYDVDVSLTRRGERDIATVNGRLSSAERIAFANALGAQVFVSFQAGGLFNPELNIPGVFHLAPPGDVDLSGSGGSVRWWTDQSSRGSLTQWRVGSAAFFEESRDLAESLLAALRRSYENIENVEFEDRPRTGRLSCLQGLLMPGVLVELGSLTSLESEQILCREGFQRKLAESLAVAIGNWVYRQEGRPIPDTVNP